jgi:CheY-like chemotaxis protein
VAPDRSLTPPFEDLLARGQELLAQLSARHDALSRDLGARLAELSQARGELSQTRTELTQTRAELSQARTELTQTRADLTQARALQRQLQVELEALRTARQTWAAERERMIVEIDRLRKAQDALSASHEALKATSADQATQLAALHEEREQLKDLHTHVTNQTSKLAADWSARRDTLTTEKQRLAAELEEARKTAALGLERERQWRAQVWKLQDDLKNLRGASGRVTLTEEQSHHVFSQLNAIIGFAEVLLDEAGNRATGTERQEFLQHIKSSGAEVVEYMNRLMGVAAVNRAPAESVDEQPLVAPPGAPAVLVAAADETVRERIEPLLTRAGYQVEFAANAAEALKAAVELQPLAIVVDTDLPPKGAQRLIDDLSGEPRVRDIPVVLTVKNDEEQLGLSMGQVDFLRKPINRQQLLQVMAKFDLLADRRRASKMPTSVLVIDDDPRNTRLVQAMLKPFSIEVLSSHEGAAGIKLARTRKPDLIVLDLMMPEVDGFEVVTTLRDDPATAQIPILIYSAKNITAADRQRLQGNIQAIIRKGELSKEQFLEMVYRRGERRRRTSAEEAAA